MTSAEEESFWKFSKGYIELARSALQVRWEAFKPDMFNLQVPNAVGGLLARQVSLSIEMMKSPGVWNGHSAPLFLRAMVEAHITLSWILKEPTERAERAEKYIMYGLGQEKLFIEFLQEIVEEDPNHPDSETLEEMVRIRRGFLNSQLAEWATPVNLGSWSGISVREMAKQINRESIYKHSYVPFSGPAHSMWQHVAIYNTKPCAHALHQHHRIPSAADAPFDADFMYRSAKYLTLSFEAFDEAYGLSLNIKSPLDYFVGNGDEDEGADSGDNGGHSDDTGEAPSANPSANL